MMILSEREKIVLSSIIMQFVQTAEPVGSKSLAYSLDLGLSPATIRNVMAGLEEKGLITHPHTSAGRVPTTQGYKIYIQNLMRRKKLSREEKELIYHTLRENVTDFDSFLETTSKLLANITHQLSFLTIPVLESSSLEKLDVVPINQSRIMIAVYVTSGIIKSIYIQLQEEFDFSNLDKVVAILNERLHGLKLSEIRKKFQLLIQDIPVNEYGILKVIVKNYKTVFDENFSHEFVFKGTKNLLLQPEFMNNPKAADVLNIIEEREQFLKIFTSVQHVTRNIKIAIGEDIPVSPMQDCSIIISDFHFGEESGKIGVVGPTRMDYRHVFAFLDFTAKVISELIKSN
jgi:heat-inducible transcriptional repressor